MNNLYDHIEAEIFQLSNTNRLIANTILKHKNSTFNLKLTELAEQSYCSNAAITKFIHYFGYSSYKVFVNDLNNQEYSEHDGIIDSLKLVDIYIKENKETIIEFIDSIRAANKIYIFGTGQSAVAPIDFTLKCNKKENNKYIFEANPLTQQLLVQTVSKNDFCIFISNSGESRELIQFYKNIKYKDQCILISNRQPSTLSRLIEHKIVLNNYIEPPFNFKEFSKESKYSLMYFLDRIFEILYPKNIG